MKDHAAAPRSAAPLEEQDIRVRWSGLSLTFDEQTLNAIVHRLVDRIADLQDLKVRVTPGELGATLLVHRFGVPLSAKASLSQLRLKDGFLAFVLDKVQALLVEKYSLPPGDITPQSTLESLGLDSLDLIELLFEVEDEFNIRVPQEGGAALRSATVQEIADSVDRVVAENATPAAGAR